MVWAGTFLSINNSTTKVTKCTIISFISLGLGWFASLPLSARVHSPSSLLVAYPTGFPINSLMEVDFGYLEGWTAIGIRYTPSLKLCGIILETFRNSLDNALSSIVFYVEMKVEVDVGVHDIGSRITPRYILMNWFLLC